MPTREPIQNTLIPKVEEKPIPTRVVVTKPAKIENTGQQITDSPAAEPAKTEESVKLSPQLSAIARKEQAFRQREQALKDREKQVEAKLAQATEYEELKAKLSAKDFSEAEKLGLNYEEYTKYLLDKQNGVDPQKEEMASLKEKVKSFEERLEEEAAAQFQATVSEYRKEIQGLVAEDPEFSSIKELKGEESVLQLILDTFEEDGEELTIREAAKLVEEQVVKRGEIFSKLPKLKPKEEERKVLPRPMVGKTLTNDMTVNSEKRPLKSLQHLSEAERYAEARRRVLERRAKG